MAEESTHLEEENRRLQRAVEELSILNEIASAISSTMSLSEIVDSIVAKCVRHLRVEQTSVQLLEQQAQNAELRTMVRRVDTRVSDQRPLRFGDQLTGWMLKHQQPLLVNDLGTDDRFQRIASDSLSIQSFLSVPLLLKGTLIGLLSVFNKREGTFTKEDQRLLSIIATQSAQVIENARLYEGEQNLRLIEEELRVAHHTQMRLLPSEMPSIEGYDIYGTSTPARNVGGDYFDFIVVDEQRIAICLGDVTGKGMPAALLMSNVQATVRGQTLQDLPPDECLSHANDLLVRTTEPHMFVTLFYGILDTVSDTFTYSNGGHNPPFLFSGDDRSELTEGGLIVGIMENSVYESGAVTLSAGDVLVIFSDGITEAMNATELMFEEDRLCQAIKACRDLSAEEIAAKVVEAVRVFAGDVEQADDMTLVVVKRSAG